jgi:hypothetical protein
MDIQVAVRASPIELTVGSQNVGGVVEGSGVPGLISVTLLAEVRPSSNQQLVVVRPVGVVAVQAVLNYRWVIPQEGTAFLGVALVTFLVDRLRRDHLVDLGPMGVVTVKAGNQPFTYRMV